MSPVCEGRSPLPADEAGAPAGELLCLLLQQADHLPAPGDRPEHEGEKWRRGAAGGGERVGRGPAVLHRQPRQPVGRGPAALQHCYWGERVAVIPDVEVGDGDAGGGVNRQRRRQSLL